MTATDKNRRHRQQLLQKLLLLLIFAAGLAILSYPFCRNALNEHIDQARMAAAAARNHKNAAAQKQRIDVYNQQVKRNGLVPMADPFSDGNETQIAAETSLEEHLIGAISIPAIRITLPLFDRTEEKLLQQGAALMQGTSFPGGGEGTHGVISAHSGLPERKLFTDLENVHYGDRILLTLFGEKLAYQVQEIRIVLPSETGALELKQGRELLTLLTCTPYMVNSHRLLVTAERIPLTSDLEQEVRQADRNRHNRQQLLAAGLLFIVASLLLLTARLFLRYRKLVKRVE